MCRGVRRTASIGFNHRLWPSKYGSLHYEKLQGDKAGTSSVRVNDQYRIEFTEEVEEGQTVATICNITELSNHYQ